VGRSLVCDKQKRKDVININIFSQFIHDHQCKKALTVIKHIFEKRKQDKNISTYVMTNK
jgi:hypothetical protein